MKRPILKKGLRHVALYVVNFEKTVQFYTDIMGLRIEWQPDADNFYLTSGQDNLALHRAPADFHPGDHQRLDHIGFILDTAAHVDQWQKYMQTKAVPIIKEAKTHRDGARSFYCKDPDDNVIQMIYHPPLSG